MNSPGDADKRNSGWGPAREYLLDNADKYTDPGTSTRLRADHDGDTLVLSVEDEGHGIPAGDLDRVFEKFTRLSTGDGRPAGTGLGLAIAKGFVEAMGGSIHAESPVRAGQGSRIVIRLPTAKPSDALPPLVEQEPARAGVALYSRGG